MKTENGKLFPITTPADCPSETGGRGAKRRRGWINRSPLTAHPLESSFPFPFSLLTFQNSRPCGLKCERKRFSRGKEMPLTDDS